MKELVSLRCLILFITLCFTRNVIVLWPNNTIPFTLNPLCHLPVTSWISADKNRKVLLSTQSLFFVLGLRQGEKVENPCKKRSQLKRELERVSNQNRRKKDLWDFYRFKWTHISRKKKFLSVFSLIFIRMKKKRISS